MMLIKGSSNSRSLSYDMKIISIIDALVSGQEEPGGKQNEQENV